MSWIVRLGWQQSDHSFSLGCRLVRVQVWSEGLMLMLTFGHAPCRPALLRPLKHIIKAFPSSTSVSHLIGNVNVITEHWSPKRRLRWTGVGVVRPGWSPSFFLLQGKVTTCWRFWVDLACDLQLLWSGKLLCSLALMVSCLFSRASKRKPTSC